MKAVGVFSIKGGTGKTTIALNLANKLKKHGKVALLDADIDNSSFAQFVKIDKQIDIEASKTIKLPDWDGVKVFSMSLVAGSRGVSMNEDRYVQIINDVMQYGDWGDLDYLIIDLPPGSSNIWRSILVIFSEILAGDVIVSIPSMTDSLVRAIDVHKYYDIPIIAVVENMSYFECEHGAKYHLFGEPSANKYVNAPVIQLPIIPNLHKNVLIEHEAINDLVDLVVKTPVVKTSFLERVKETVSKEIKDLVVKVLATLIVRIQKEIDAKNIASKYGFTEQKPFVLTITDESMSNVLTRVVMKVKDGRLVVLKSPEKVEYEIVASYKTLARMILGKAKIGNQIVSYDPFDAWLKGDIVVYGMGSVPKALGVLRHVLSEESFVKEVRNKYEKLLERFI